MVHEYLSKEAYWAIGRELNAIKKSIENSICFGVYINEKQVGFGRVVTDHAVFAWVLDIFILKEFQGKGLGKSLMENIMNHQDLRDVPRWGLMTKDAHGLYSKFGFTPSPTPEKLMVKRNE